MPDPLAAGAGLASAASWGSGDFAGGLASRRASVWRIVFVSQAVGVAFMTLLALAVGEARPPTRDLLVGVAAGASGAIGIVALYAALGIGQMGVVAPVTAILGAALPIVVGIAREGAPAPLAMAGIALAFPGVWLLSRAPGARSRAGLGLAMLSGLGFGGFFVLIALASEASLVWPLLAARAATLAAVALVLLARRESPVGAPLGLSALAGVGDTLGNAFFVLAAAWGRLDTAAILASLYPAATVILARIVLKERLGRGQLVGLALTLVAIVLVAL